MKKFAQKIKFLQKRFNTQNIPKEIEDLQTNFGSLSKTEKYSASTTLGEYFLENSDLQKGKAYFLKSFALSKEELEPGLYARTLIGLVSLYMKLSELKEAETYANLLKKEAPRILFPKIRSNAYVTLGRFFRISENYRQSITFYYEAIETEIDEKKKLEIQYEVGNYLLERKDYENAQSYFNYGLKDSLVKYFEDLELKFLFGLAKIKILKNRRTSYHMFEEVIARAETLDSAFHKEVSDYYEFERVKERIESNYARFLEISDPEVQDLLINEIYELISSVKSHDFEEEFYIKITNFLFEKKRFEQAEKTLQMAQRVSDKKKSDKYQLDLLSLWAMIKYFIKEFDKSMEYIDKVLKMENIPFEALVNMKVFRVNILFYTQDFERAIQTCQELKTLAEEQSNPQVQAISYHKLGCIQMMTNELSKSQESLEKALSFVKDSQSNLESTIQSDLQFLSLVTKLKKTKKIEVEDVDKLIYYLFTADYEHSLIFFNKFYNSLSKSSFLKIQVLYQIILIYKIHLPDPEKEKESVKKALKLIESVPKKELDDKEMVQLIIAFNSTILVKERKYEESNRILLNLIDTIKIKDLELLRLIYYQIGVNYSVLEKLEKSKEYFEKALEVSKDDPSFQIEVLVNLGLNHKSNRLKMDEYLTEAIQLARENELYDKEKKIEKLLVKI